MRMELAAVEHDGLPDQPGAGLRIASPPAGGVAGDFWDVINPGVVGQQQPFSGNDGFDQIISSDRGLTARKIALYGALAGVLAIAGYFVFQMLVYEKDPFEHAQELYTQALEAIGLAEPPPAPVVKRHKKKAVAVKAAEPEAKKPASTVAGNPYWSLPNKLLGKEAELRRTWTAEEEETWRAGLAHRFAYQRYKTVQDVRERRLKGSEAILWDALQDKQFWMRGFAAIGIAEFNVEISLQSLETVIGDARSELIANFFERFTKKPTAPQAFVLRQILRLVDERGRIVALKGIAHSRDDLRELYLAAATKDPGPHVQRWIKAYLAEHPFKPERYNELMTVVDGSRSGDDVLGDLDARPSAPAAKKTRPLHLATDEELDKELSEFEKSTGDVEFYEAEGNAIELTDPETFEYPDAQGTKIKVSH